MQLFKCPDCQKSRSPRSHSCPHCGRQDTNYWLMILGAAWMAISVLVILFVGYELVGDSGLMDAKAMILALFGAFSGITIGSLIIHFAGR